MKVRPTRVTVVGGSRCDERVASIAERVGQEIARRGGVLVSGGRGGVMEAASRGASEAGGLTVGILPGPDASAANAFVEIPIPTGMGEARNVVNVRAGDVVIALPGSYGTLSEIAFAVGAGIPVVAVPPVPPGVEVVEAATAEEAVAVAFELAGERGG